MPVITISRQMCSFGDDIAEALSRRLNWDLISRTNLFHYFPDIASSPFERNLLAESAKYYLNPRNGKGTVLEALTKELQSFAEKKPAVLVGFGSQVIFANSRDALHVRIVASKPVRVSRAKKLYHVSDEEAKRILDTADKRHKKFVSTVFGADNTDPSFYHLILNTAFLSVDECVSAILTLYGEQERLRQSQMQIERPESKDHPAERPVFKNQSEAEFAEILDTFQLEWKYEPKTFPIEWDAEGNVTMAFSPDFYLPRFDTYIELTTMDQRYVTLKNKKVKKLRELYPGINIKIVYKKDFYSLIERFKLNRGENE